MKRLDLRSRGASCSIHARRMLPAVICGTVLLLGIASAACGFDEFTSRYSDVHAARSAGAFARGWLPDIVPETSTDIREVHNIDTNDIRASFRFVGPIDLAPMTQLTSGEATSAVVPDIGRLPEWPRWLMGSVDSAGMAAAGYRAYRYGHWRVVLNVSEGRGFAWVNGSELQLR